MKKGMKKKEIKETKRKKIDERTTERKGRENRR
jgi:hypothetical protein